MIDMDEDDDVPAIEGVPDEDFFMPPDVHAAYARLAAVANESFVTLDQVIAALPVNTEDVVLLRTWAKSYRPPAPMPAEVRTERAQRRLAETLRAGGAMSKALPRNGEFDLLASDVVRLNRAHERALRAELVASYQRKVAESAAVQMLTDAKHMPGGDS